MSDLKQLIREVPDFPKPGINFYDITTLLKNGPGLKCVSTGWSSAIATSISMSCSASKRAVSSLRRRLPTRLECGFVPVRKPKKLPAATERIEYALEYGTDVLEIHKDAIEPGQRVLIIDDVLATGGTAAAVCKLVEKLGGTVAGLGFVIELDFLKGETRLNGHEKFALVHY